MKKSAWFYLVILMLVAGCVPYTAPLPAPTPQPIIIIQTVVVQPSPTPAPTVTAAPIVVSSPAAVAAGASQFTPAVEQWRDHIRTWSVTYGVSEQMIATVIQMMSCGDPNYTDTYRYGLFGVNYFNFQPEDNKFDVETNARLGLSLLSHLSQQTNDYGLVLAGYFGGPGVMIRSWDTWGNETQRFYWNAVDLYKGVSTGADVCPG